MSARQPQSTAELQDLVRESPRLHARGLGSKSALHAAAKTAIVADLSRMNGILEYQPSEYTVTVRAGTPVRDLKAALAEKGQYLPFDPLLPDRATVGGTVAANLAGSRRFRYGGVRDFILGAQVVDGAGRAFRVGGKVVKNAAGFDLSKFLVGSLGQYAIMTELAFKVFPDAPRFRNLRFEYKALTDALDAIYWLNQSDFELDALDLVPGGEAAALNGGAKDAQWSLLTRLAGLDETLPGRVERFTARVTAETMPGDADELEETEALWDPLAGLRGDCLVKVVLPPKQISALEPAIARLDRRYGVGGNLLWLATDDIDALDAALSQLGLRGLCLRGTVASPLLGSPVERILSARVKQALDPHGKLV